MWFGLEALLARILEWLARQADPCSFLHLANKIKTGRARGQLLAHSIETIPRRKQENLARKRLCSRILKPRPRAKVPEGRTAGAAGKLRKPWSIKHA
ncbi:hypothetical protein LX36DRAFT_417272 [Colletotrichum falcatum]|nr:hypothetical protein LX36DRAFT_417272 [Colletotrichum falcatum]